MGALISLMAQSVAFGRVAQAVSGRIRVQLFGSILRQEVSGFPCSVGRYLVVL